MTMEGNGKPDHYKIDMSGIVAQEIKQLKKDAVKKGRTQDVKNALAIILGRLSSNPLDFGELVSDFKKLNLIVHVAVVPPLFVRFAIHEEIRFVVIMKIQFLPT